MTTFRSRFPSPSRSRLGHCLVLALGLLVLPSAQAAPAKSSKATKNAKPPRGASKTPPAPTPPPPAPEPVPEPVAPPAPEPRPAVEARPAAPRPAPAPERSAEPSPASTSRRLRLGLGPDLFFESARLTGTQTINESVRDESFDYASDGFLSATLWLTVPVDAVSERLRAGLGARLFGNYAAAGGRMYGFGLLNELFVSGEYGLPVADRTEVVLAARLGLSLLVPGREFAEDIAWLQAQGLSVWSVPRLGWLVGPSAGVRRRMTERIWLRADLLGQVGQQYLFATSQEISGLQYSKTWSTLALRLGLSLGVEFSL